MKSKQLRKGPKDSVRRAYPPRRYGMGTDSMEAEMASRAGNSIAPPQPPTQPSESDKNFGTAMTALKGIAGAFGGGGAGAGGIGGGMAANLGGAMGGAAGAAGAPVAPGAPVPGQLPVARKGVKKYTEGTDAVSEDPPTAAQIVEASKHRSAMLKQYRDNGVLESVAQERAGVAYQSKLKQLQESAPKPKTALTPIDPPIAITPADATAVAPPKDLPAADPPVSTNTKITPGTRKQQDPGKPLRRIESSERKYKLGNTGEEFPTRLPKGRTPAPKPPGWEFGGGKTDEKIIKGVKNTFEGGKNRVKGAGRNPITTGLTIAGLAAGTGLTFGSSLSNWWNAKEKGNDGKPLPLLTPAEREAIKARVLRQSRYEHGLNVDTGERLDTPYDKPPYDVKETKEAIAKRELDKELGDTIPDAVVRRTPNPKPDPTKSSVKIPPTGKGEEAKGDTKIPDKATGPSKMSKERADSLSKVLNEKRNGARELEAGYAQGTRKMGPPTEKTREEMEYLHKYDNFDRTLYQYDDMEKARKEKMKFANITMRKDIEDKMKSDPTSPMGGLLLPQVEESEKEVEAIPLGGTRKLSELGDHLFGRESGRKKIYGRDSHSEEEHEISVKEGDIEKKILLSKMIKEIDEEGEHNASRKRKGVRAVSKRVKC